MKENNKYPILTENNAKYIIFGLVFITYFVLLKYPFIQDDWGIIYNQVFNSFSFWDFFDFKDKLFFRPFGQLYSYIYLLIFGINPLPFHLISLIIHFFNSYLVFRITREIFSTYDLSFAFKIACLYAVASSIHSESLLWMVGIYELGSTFFFFSTIFLFIKNRTLLSAFAFITGLCFKESGLIFVMMILISYLIIYKKGNLRNVLIKLWPHFLIVVIFGIIRLYMASPLSLSDDDPYLIRIFSINLISKQLFKFSLYSIQSVFPYGITLLLICLIAVALLTSIVFNKIKGSKNHKGKEVLFNRKDALFMTIWLFSGLMPVFFLVNHAYRYYLTLSLPAVIFFFLFIITFLFNNLNLKYKKHIINFVILFSIISSVFYVYYSDSLPYNKYRLGYGSNGLFSRGKTVKLVSENLIKTEYNSSSEEIILVDNIDVFSFDKDSGPSVWLNNKFIKIYDMNNLQSDSSGVFINNPAMSQGEAIKKSKENRRILLDSNRTHAFIINNNMLTKISWSDLINYKALNYQSNSSSSLKEYLLMLIKDF